MVMIKWDNEKNECSLEFVLDVDHDGDANEKKFNNACQLVFNVINVNFLGCVFPQYNFF